MVAPVTDSIGQILSPVEAEQAIYIDFEGTQEDPACLLGVLVDGSFTQYVLDGRLHPAGASQAKGTRAGRSCVNSDLTAVVQAITDRVVDRRLLVVAFSRHDLQVIEKLEPDASEVLRPAFRDGKQTAKRWARIVHPDYQFEVRPRGGRYSLDQFLRLVGYPVPRIHGPGNTGDRLRYVIRQLEQKQGYYERISPGAKAKWSNLLMHNHHDVHGLHRLCVVAATELASSR